jgi:hypothetical protein
VTGIIAGDPDQDGDLDLMVTSDPSSDVAFYQNSGEGLFERAVRYGANKSPWSPFYADFTGDQIDDLVVCSHLPPSGTFAGVSLIRGLSPLPSEVPDGAGVARLSLAPCYPNPFTGHTWVSFNLNEAAEVKLRLFDVAGRRVATLLEESLPPGPHSLNWNGRDEGGRRLASGTYLLRLDAPGASRTGKLVVVQQ